ncbi:MAG TPA: ABC transporter ATP-binding protein [Candidatus Paceibacterota bacterium]|nr:ABC transporter ATP-binding protein [Candidatus Paceibacterota bacterium]
MKALLEIENLKAGYEGMEILHDIDFQLQSKEIVALIGPNGAGKSTLLKSIFHLTEIYSGKIFFKEKNIINIDTNRLIQLGISYVPQGRQVFPSLTVLENLELGIFVERKGISLEKNIEDIFERFPFLRERKNDLAGNLSGGEQQLLAIGRALMQKPELLLLDEPSLGLAPKVMKEIFNTIQEINNEGIAIIIVEQNARQAVKIADKIYVLEDGKIALEGGKEILDDPRIKDIYLGGR